MKVENIVIHCSDSVFGSAAEIRRWHTGQGWRDIGYHFVITNGQIRPDFKQPEMDGCIEVGRYLNGDGVISGDEVGAHALGYNGKSVGICLIGVAAFTPAQMGALLELTSALCKRYGLKASAVIGHYETAQAGGKTCPNIDMQAFRALLGKTL